MSDAAGIAPVIAAPVVDVAPVDTGNDNGDVESFDRDAALASLNEGGEETTAEATPEKSTEEQTEEERQAARRKKFSDEKGKLDQDKLDGAFAKLTAEGRRHKARVAEHKANVEKFQSEKQQYDAAIEAAAQRVNARDKEFADFQEQAKTSPLTVLEKFGWSVEKLINFIQNDGKHTPEETIKETRAEYDKRLEAQAKEIEELKNTRKQDTVRTAAQQYEAKAIEKMQGLMQGYELVSKYDLTTEVAPKVLQNIAHIYREGGEINGVKYPKGTALDPKVVLDHFEAQEAKALARFGFRPGQAGATNSVVKPGAVQPKSLSNADTSSRSVKVNDDEAPFDRDEAMREVQRMLHG